MVPERRVRIAADGQTDLLSVRRASAVCLPACSSWQATSFIGQVDSARGQMSSIAYVVNPLQAGARATFGRFVEPRKARLDADLLAELRSSLRTPEIRR